MHLYAVILAFAMDLHSVKYDYLTDQYRDGTIIDQEYFTQSCSDLDSWPGFDGAHTTLCNLQLMPYF